MKKQLMRMIAVLVTAALMFSLTAFAADEGQTEARIVQSYGDYSFAKISNPTIGPGEPDGINTNDINGFEANRFNSYAWAMESRGDCIYIGTNRTLFGSAMNALVETLQQQNPNFTQAYADRLITLLSGGDVPVGLDDMDYIPQIIKFDLANGETSVIYTPPVAYGDDGRLYYTDENQAIMPEADVPSEACSFRSVVKLGDSLYFGSLGSHMLQIVRIDQEDNAEVVYQTTAQGSSLRASCIHDAGDGETVFIGGQDSTYQPWRAYRAQNPDSKVRPIVIRHLAPETAGTDQESWNNVVGDFSDFGEYASATIYGAAGGNVWDLCSYNGRLYVILAYEQGWVMFRGEQGGKSPNQYGWTWTEVVGRNGKYPMAMDETIGPRNLQLQQDYSCYQYSPALGGMGLLDSTATPYVYHGKMYIGTFDNATIIQSNTMTKMLIKLQHLMTFRDFGDTGPTLAEIYAPIYEVMSHPQSIWVMDEDETIVAADSANELLAGTTNDYVWRFIEQDGRLYAGTFDSSTAYTYFLNLSIPYLVKRLIASGSKTSEAFEDLQSGVETVRLQLMLDDIASEDSGAAADFTEALTGAYDSFSRFLRGESSVAELLEQITRLQSARAQLTAGERLFTANTDSGRAVSIPTDAVNMADWILRYLDTDGLSYLAGARSLANNASQGFDILCTDNGETWERITADGLGDPYNYGARTFTVCNGELYVGTANPYYGAQLWKITPDPDIDCPMKAFQDLDRNEWYHDGIHYCIENGLMNGVGNNKFDPNGTTSRAMIVTILYRLENEPEVTAENPFNDVEAGKWYTDAVIWAAENKIVDGYGDGTFCPNGDITREQLAAILYRYAKYKGIDVSIGEDTNILDFADAGAWSDWSVDALQWAVGSGIIKGRDGKLVPKGDASRAEAATMIQRFCTK